MATNILTNYSEDIILNSWFRGTSAYKPSAIYVGLLTAVTDAEAGTVTEVSGGSYARQQITQVNGSWNAPTNVSGAQTITNVSAVTFPTASASWGTVTHIGIYDASTSGNLLMVIDLNSSRTISNGDTFTLPAANISIGGN